MRFFGRSTQAWRLFFLMEILAFQAMGCYKTAEEVMEKKVEVPAGTELFVANKNGRILVKAGEGKEMRIRAVKKVRTMSSPSKLLKDIQVTVSLNRDTAPNRLMIAAIHPDSSLSRMYEVSFEISVPVGTRLDLDTTNGSIRLSDVKGAVNAKTRNGGIQALDISGKSTLSTRNGGIRARGAFLELTAETRNGGINVETVDEDLVPTPAGKTMPAKPVEPKDKDKAPEESHGSGTGWKRFGREEGAKNEKIASPEASSDPAKPKKKPIAKAPKAAVGKKGAGARVSLRSSNGSIRLAGKVRAFRAETHNGSVKIMVREGSVLSEKSHAVSRNGSITLMAFEGFSCTIKASTSLGSVRSDFPLARSSSKSASGEIGGGGPVVELSTSNGSIRITREAR